MAKKAYDPTKKAKQQVPNAEFLEQAPTLNLSIEGMPLQLDPKEFKTGSVGYGECAQFTVLLKNGTVVKISGTMNFVVTGSKPAEEKDAA